jgi:hypothetical protein
MAERDPPALLPQLKISDVNPLKKMLKNNGYCPQAKA